MDPNSKRIEWRYRTTQLSLRMKNLLLLASSICIASFSKGQLTAQLQSVFEEHDLMGMSVWVHCQGHSTEYHFGLRDFTRELPMNEDSKYRIASISKTITSLGLMKLYDQGLFELDDDISDYMGYQIINPNHPSTPVTFRMLLSHTSSLQDGTGYNGFISATFSQNPIPNISQLLVPGGTNYTANMWRLENPGSHFAYSNANYALIGTLIEQISGERFDLFMQEEILTPLGITGSFNVTLLPDINDVAVIYRNQGGWNPQVDNYQGLMPNPINTTGYQPGTNGLLFGPQGSLRASAGELGKVMLFYMTNGQSAPGLLSSETLDLMRSMQWSYNGSNGDNYYGLFNRWGLGLHHANTVADDQICLNQGWGTFIGHPGEAYGLVSDAYFNEENEVALVFMHNGIFGGHQNGVQSIYYTVEEDVFNTICAHWAVCSNNIFEDARLGFAIAPQPSNPGEFIIRIPNGVDSIRLDVINSGGQTVAQERFTGSEYSLNLTSMANGVYVINISSSIGTATLKAVK